MGNESNKKPKIKGTGDDFNVEKSEIYKETGKDRRRSYIHYDSKIIVSEIKSDPYNDYKLIKSIGEGTFGKIELVEHKITGKVRAMKAIKKIESDETSEASILNELNILKQIDHQNILKIYEYYIDADNYYLITEYCSGGNLYDVMKTTLISELQAACIMYQILLAINHIHKLKIMHRDLKLENILVSKKEDNGLYRIKICDFGTSFLFKEGEKEKNIAGSSYYIAPEVFMRNYDFKCDLWSCGVIMFVLLTKKIPFLGKNEEERKKYIMKKGYCPEPLQIYSKYVKDLINDLLERDYEKRLNAQQALTYEIFKVYNCKETINNISLDEIKFYINNIKKYKKANIFEETAISYLTHNSDLEEIDGPLKLFNLLDNNENGKIGYLEFNKGLCDIIKEQLNEEEVKEIFYNLDTNNNGYFEQEEFIKAAVDKKLLLNDKNIRFAFNFFDQDKSGLITIDEITELFKDNTDKDIDATKEFKKIIDSLDKDSDGRINIEEFSKFMKALLERF
jgi:calcium-dependent protein kinase